MKAAPPPLSVRPRPAKPQRGTRYYRILRRKAQAVSLSGFLVQTIGCFVLLGPGLALALSYFGGYFWAGFPQPYTVLTLLSAPLGFLLSLCVDYRQAPWWACLPLRRIRARWKEQIRWQPNRVFFSGMGPAQPAGATGNFGTIGSIGGRLRSPAFWVFLALGLGALASWLSNAVAWLLLFLWPDLPRLQEEGLGEIFQELSLGQAFVGVVILPAVLEELVFRGRGFFLVQRTWGTKGAIFWSSLVFAGMHGGVLEIVSLLPFAFFLGWLRSRSGNLGYCMLVHFQNNGFAFLVYWLTEIST